MANLNHNALLAFAEAAYAAYFISVGALEEGIDKARRLRLQRAVEELDKMTRELSDSGIFEPGPSVSLVRQLMVANGFPVEVPAVAAVRGSVELSD
ncbi:hypothetical protein [Niveibacterium sp. SC-1]|uniref:hypothetical protein n=1 Tax=Niveibacterium sp. SC-1 TaxID=3135646 RepID=UPI00311F4C50